MMSGFEARGKWDAYEAKKGMSQDDAKAAYVDLVKGILGEWNAMKLIVSWLINIT